METLWQELSFGIGDGRHLLIVVIRLVASTLFGAAIGFERGQAGKSAGLRTHLLVTVGTTVFVLACSASGMASDPLSRVIQGIVTGIGFIGAGSIIKDEERIKGLTTSAGIWMAAAIGVTTGLGEVGLAALATLLALLILRSTLSIEEKLHIKTGGGKKKEKAS
jgi:putative Mg2+ transporter-C (MgtC) family protein